MCGITGIINLNNAPVNEEILRKMIDSLTHRGPDSGGIYVDNFMGLGHRRLKIIDLSDAGAQPMCNEDGTVWLVLNGEIYNFLKLKENLQLEGHIFKSNSDAEVVLHLYEKYGEDFVQHINGMFAFGIWDKREKKLILGRDRIGKKPLVYFFRDGIFAFASELAALLSSNLVSKDINAESLDCYLSFGYINAPHTIYKHIFKVPPAHLLILKNDKVILKRYWALDYSKKIKISPRDAVVEARALLREAVKDRLYSDVPLGVFLSGGLDSSSVTAIVSSLYSGRVKTFSIGFGMRKYDELDYARSIARHFDTDHHEFIVTPQAIDVLPILVKRYGEPFADSSAIPTYYVANYARKYVTVALNGDGGDESFVGYLRYLAVYVSRIIHRLPSFLGHKIFIRGLQKLCSFPQCFDTANNRMYRFLRNSLLPIDKQYGHYMGVFDQGLKDILYSPDFRKQLHSRSPESTLDDFLLEGRITHLVDRMLYADVHTYLPGDLLVKMDIAAMANSLESRSPFLDFRLMEFMASLPVNIKFRHGITKYILKKAMSQVLPAKNLCRGKMGFGVPINEWFRAELKAFLLDNLLSQRSLKRGYFNPKSLEQFINDHISNKRNYGHQLWALLVLELWHRQFLDA